MSSSPIYAATTSVSVDKSQAEIKKILQRYGARGFVFGETEEKAMIGFEMNDRRIQFILPFHYVDDSSRRISATARKAREEQVMRSRWRSLALAIKAKLECVASGIGTFEEEFLAHIVLPNGRTMGEIAIPQIASSYKENKMPPLLGYAQ